MPGLPRQGPVRRCLRSLRQRLRPDRPDRALLHHHRRSAGLAQLPSTSSSGSPIPRCRQFLAEWTGSGRLQPEVANKAREWLGGDGTSSDVAEADDPAAAPADLELADWDISRDAPYFGIPIPDAPGKFFYVWLDAPVGYLASLKAHCARVGLDFGSFVAPGDATTADGMVREQVHFIGKDIIYFHTLFWPAMLKFADFKVPDHIHVHGFLTVSGEKMSKSRGTGLSPLKYLDLGMNPEWLRYYLAAKLNSRVEDVDFNADDFIARVNSDLIGKLVNIASRCAGFLTKRFDGVLAEADPATARLFVEGMGRPRRGGPALPAARIRQGDPGDHGFRRPGEPLRGQREALGAREETGPGRAAASRLLRCPAGLSRPGAVARAGAAGHCREGGPVPEPGALELGPAATPPSCGAIASPPTST